MTDKRKAQEQAARAAFECILLSWGWPAEDAAKAAETRLTQPVAAPDGQRNA